MQLSIHNTHSPPHCRDLTDTPESWHRDLPHQAGKGVYRASHQTPVCTDGETEAQERKGTTELVVGLPVSHLSAFQHLREPKTS